MDERIKLAAWKDPRTGKIYTGDMHVDAWYEAMRDDPDYPDKTTGADVWAEWMMLKIGDELFFASEGFITTSERFVDREEGLIIAKKYLVLSEYVIKSGSLCAENLIGAKEIS